jgi:hypothetical protein
MNFSATLSATGQRQAITAEAPASAAARATLTNSCPWSGPVTPVLQPDKTTRRIFPASKCFKSTHSVPPPSLHRSTLARWPRRESPRPCTAKCRTRCSALSSRSRIAAGVQFSPTKALASNCAAIAATSAAAHGKSPTESPAKVNSPTAALCFVKADSANGWYVTYFILLAPTAAVLRTTPPEE